jgi:hypothetical protein
MLRAILPGQAPGGKTCHQTSQELLPTKLSPGRFHDGPVVRRSALVGHEVYTIGGRDLRRETVGDSGTKPLNIMLLFIPLVRGPS